MPLPALPRATAIAAALVFAAVGPAAQAGEDGAKARSETRVGMSEAEFKAANAELFAQGLRLVDLTVAETNGQAVIGAIWWWNEGMAVGTAERAAQLQGQVYLKQSEQDVRALAERFGPQGSQPEVIDSYTANGKTWFATVFSLPGEAPLQPVGAFLTDEQVGGMRDQARANGFDLLRLDVYLSPEGARYLPVFGQRPSAEIEIISQDAAVRLQAQAAGFVARDMAPMSVSVFETGERDKVAYVASFDHAQGRELLVSLAPEEFRQQLAGRLGDGQVIDLDSYAYQTGVQYSAVIVPGRKKVDTGAYKDMAERLERAIKK